jgi:predicted dehydrogenase
LQWLSNDVHSQRKPIHLVNGNDLTKASSFVMDGREYTQWEGFTLQSVAFANLTGDKHEEAIVVLHYRTGGTQNTNYVYVYTFLAGNPKLLAYFSTGDRAYHGLCRVFGESGNLVVELFDPDKREGDCCSSGIVRTRYKWQHRQFEAIGPVERETLEEE